MVCFLLPFGGMKRHLYYDQQLPQEEIPDAAHALVIQSVFARNLPTQEDEYFYELEHAKFDNDVETESFGFPFVRPAITQFQNANGFLDRITHTMTRGIDWNWQF